MSEKAVVYLCGPINGCTDEEAKDWREYAKKTYGDKYDFLDPMRNDYRGRENEEGIDAVIVEADKHDLDRSDAMLVNYDKPSVGTSMEIMYAWETNPFIFIVVVAKPDAVISPWLKYHSDAIVPSFAEAFKTLEEAAVEEPEDAPTNLFEEISRDWKKIFGEE
jgi:nucleoside 2-deoxyribosyltransferase